MEHSIPALQLQEMEPCRHAARLPVVESAARANRHCNIAIQMVRVASRPVLRMVPLRCDTGRQPLPHCGSRHSPDQPRRRSEEVFSWDPRKCGHQRVGQTKVMALPEQVANALRVLAACRLEVLHIRQRELPPSTVTAQQSTRLKAQSQRPCVSTVARRVTRINRARPCNDLLPARWRRELP
jgi:hypothetical protein